MAKENYFKRLPRRKDEYFIPGGVKVPKKEELEIALRIFKRQLKEEGKLNIEGTDFGKKDLTVKADREDIADNEDFGPGDGFVDIGNGKVYVLKPGGNKESFTAENYEIIDLKSLY